METKVRFARMCLGMFARNSVLKVSAHCIFTPSPITWSELNFKLRCRFRRAKDPFSADSTTPVDLSEWFADDVNIKKDVFTFFWDGSEESARLVTQKREEFVKFRWMEHEEEGAKTFFEMRIKIDPLTG